MHAISELICKYIFLPPVMLNGKRVKRAQHVQLLGVYVEHLNWNHHIGEVCLKLPGICGVLYKVRGHLTSDALLSIYYTHLSLLKLCCVGLCLALISQKVSSCQKENIDGYFSLKQFILRLKCWYHIIC